LDGTGKNKADYDKIDFCGKQASRDELRYFWVDTCCIYQSSSREVGEAINSMFDWYSNAARCYVYLSDVPSVEHDQNSQSSKFTWESAFRASRWFARGWTLQELLAPTSVEFFSQTREQLGDKELLGQLVHEIMGIPLKPFKGNLCIISVWMSDFYGLKIARLHSKKIGHILFWAFSASTCR
jgi:hypothetical protein